MHHDFLQLMNSDTFGSTNSAVPLVSFFGGPFGERLGVTRDCLGIQDNFAADGIRVDASLTQFYQGVVHGGTERASKYGGKIDYFLNIDGDKAGLWDGFTATMHAETRYGTDVNAIDGMYSFGNFNMALPQAGQDVTDITRLIFSQSLSDDFTVFGGKINSLDDFQLNFTGRNGIDRFINSAVVANVINARTVPYSTYGVGFSVLREEAPVFTFVMRDPDNRPATGDWNQLFENGVLLSVTVKIPVTLAGLSGNRNFGGNWSSRSYTSVDPESYANVPGQGIIAGKESGSKALWYNFDQYLWVSESDPNIGWGVFGMAGISDGNPNPLKWNTTLGIGGNSLISGRERDSFGAAAFFLGMSNNFKELLGGPLAPPGIAQRDEYGVELFYNTALTSRCHLTFDLQIVEPSIKSISTSVLAGLRLKIDL